MRANLAAGVDTNWQDLMLRQGNLLNTQVGFAGGNQNTRFRAGFGYPRSAGHLHRAGLRGSHRAHST